MLRRYALALAAAAVVTSAQAAPAPAAAATSTPAPGAVPAGVQLPFEPDAELLARLRTGSCWSEFRLFDPVTHTLGEVLALEWYDKLDQSVARLYLRQDTHQRAFLRTSMRFKSKPTAPWRSATGDAGPDTVGARWEAVYQTAGKTQGRAVMEVIEGTPDADEHVSTGVLTLPGVFAQPVNVAHSAGCNRN